MGINLEQSIAKASVIMHRYHMANADQVQVIKILLDAGVERCLGEQERLRDGKEALIQRAQGSVN